MRVMQYVDEIEKGEITPQANVQLTTDAKATCVIDDGGTFGQVVGQKGVEEATSRAREYGVGMATMFRCAHTGRIGTYGEQIAELGMLGLVFSSPAGLGSLVAPFGGREARMGTNPLCLAAPSRREFPIVLDMATCVAPEGKVRNALQRSQSVPTEWLLDAQGQPTSNPQAIYDDPMGALMPLGGIVGHKGYCLAVMVDIISGALAGSGCCRPNPDAAKGRTITIFAVDVGQLLPIDMFLNQVEELVGYMASCPTLPGVDRVLVPGELESIRREEQIREGIDIPESVWERIQALDQ